MNNPIKIALTGKMRSGKSIAADYLSSTHDFERLAFASKMKRIADELFEGSDVYPTEYIEIGDPCPFDGERKQIARKPRRRYVDFGEAMRALDSQVWIRPVERLVNIYEDKRSTRGIVIEDLRLPDELEWAKDNGFTIVRVNASEEIRLARAKDAGDDFSEEDMRHRTETCVNEFSVDYEIQNDGDDVTGLWRNVDGIIKTIRGR